ncbi:PilC/PilY family type IV pilus protein [Colwellia sp. E2M01]|uniref:pilus assembly protein n=1 Tax=Colwellia sp. E2M01 TaxID=2841561 RepID=UPI001C085772|nr:PilC/PilY family type IV pilus protein [Colwellia sp. E2M01]MBU2869395.1 rRNA (guanine-N1)-methyltransferase [Colwellia sp. E2M01]
MNLLTEIKYTTNNMGGIFYSIIVSFILLFSASILAEDIDLYISESIKQTQTRPKVLLIFDNSGSMSTKENFKPSYDPKHNYSALTGYSKLSDDYIYYGKGDSAVDVPIPDSPTETRRFLSAINGCQTAVDSLKNYGLYTGRIREYTFQGNSGRWTEIPEESGESIQVIDCEDDVTTNNLNNAKMKVSTLGNTVTNLPTPQSGLPIDGEGTKTLPQLHTSVPEDSNVSWSGPYVTLYSANYLRWQQNENIETKKRERLAVAKESVTTLIRTTPNIDFGLQVFNRNVDSKNSGGRIARGIEASTTNSINDLLTKIEDEIGSDTNTPLCETLYEASRYFGGISVDYGDNDYSGSYYNEKPLRDTSVEDGGVYISPFTSCSDKVYVIYLTDGVPVSDGDADEKVKTRTAGSLTPITYSDKFEWKKNNRSYLPAMAGWMNTNDINLSLDGRQTASTYTIGFSKGAEDAESLLKETAKRGGGQYYFAEDSATLTAALTNVLANLQPSNETLTSASVASNNFDRTQTLDSVYYAMFKPDRGPRWQGNLKKYKIIDGVQTGANEIAAINSESGHFSSEVQSYWSSTVDGDDVEQGGVAETLREMKNRVIKSDLGANNGLVDLKYSDATSSYVFKTPSSLALALDVNNDESTIKEVLDWVNGKDVDDEDGDNITTGENRSDIFGDPLHSKPIVINYGDDNVYIVVGTNHGVVHMFKDDDLNNSIEETWAFMPKEFLSNIKGLRTNFTSADKIYGVDGAITSHITDHNGNGEVDRGDGDKVWLFFGYRRGGSNYYAMDVSDPNNPSVMWTIIGGSKSEAGDFTNLGQTWSQPKVAYSKLNIVSGEPKPVLIFGGGYDESKDANTIGDIDDVGNAIYMVDAETGVLKWSLAPDGNTKFDGTDSIPASIATLDSDSDGLVDRLYAGDTGGNLWRVDMPSADISEFSVFRLASLGSEITDSEDRRFFSEPSIVRTYITETIDTKQLGEDNKSIIVQQEIPYDAILIGSGDKTDPLGKDTQDTFFMIKDINIRTKQFTSTSTPAMPLVPITINDLADYTDNPFEETLTSQEKEALSLSVSLQSGWFIDLEQSGEKTTASAIVINNIVYFTTYTPPELGVQSVSCDLPNGQGWLYAVDLSLGTSKYNWASEDSKNRDDRIAFISEQFLGSPTLVVTQTKDPDTDELEVDGNLIVGRKMIDANFNPQMIRTYLYVTEE